LNVILARTQTLEAQLAALEKRIEEHVAAVEKRLERLERQRRGLFGAKEV
jgi:hypothetical protein